MAMFDKLLRKGKQLAGEYVREQLNQRSSTGQQNNQQDPRDSRSQSGYENRDYPNQQGAVQPRTAGSQGASREDQAAIEKYRYMLRTAPPQDMERAHSEAFARLTVSQRELLHAELAEQLPAAERPASQRPEDLARAATRAEVSRPGFMDKLLSRGGSGRKSMGGMAAGAAGGLGIGLLGGVAGAFIGTAIAGPLLDGFAGIGEEFGSAAEGLSDSFAGAGEQFSAAGEGLGDQAGGAFGDFLGGAGGSFGDFEF
ncbi:hypothetical protein CQ017_04885 [Arthrobacter sp. MYb224]|nr:hypothetical protein CQ017_04885 [Arthrobacter sp. MYb224]PRA04558.1 hypothetical protein CQ019_09580 [Arthrobacter sp. MYb229]PRB51530.1 hypothetical protein CQ013_06985 [Arthrobacter sp. MYb216]